MLFPTRIAIRSLVLLPFVILFLLIARGQSRANEFSVSPPPIRVASNLVLVPVSVSDRYQKPVKDLSMSDFRIAEDGHPQNIASMQEPGQSPIELALLIDVSGSVMPRFEFERKAGAEFLQAVAGPQSFVSVFTVGPEGQIIRQRTNEPAEAMSALMSLSPTRGATALYDTLALAARHLKDTASPFSRRVQVVLSDGEDTFSLTHGLDSALQELQRADCLFYSINPASSSVKLNIISRRGQEALQYLAAQTGGAAYLPADWSELPDIYRLIAADLQAQYLLAYYSSRRDTGADDFRKIVVTIPGRPDLRVRARQGYYPDFNGRRNLTTQDGSKD